MDNSKDRAKNRRLLKAKAKVNTAAILCSGIMAGVRLYRQEWEMFSAYLYACFAFSVLLMNYKTEMLKEDLIEHQQNQIQELTKVVDTYIEKCIEEAGL